MRLKRKYYDTSRSYAYTFVFYNKDLAVSEMKALSVSQQSDDPLAVLHALMVMTKNVEDFDAKRKKLEQQQSQG